MSYLLHDLRQPGRCRQLFGEKYLPFTPDGDGNCLCETCVREDKSRAQQKALTEDKPQ